MWNWIKTSLKTWFVTNWKTSALGAIAAVEIYQHTGSLKLAITAFVTGVFMSDAKTPDQHAAASTPAQTT